MITLNDIGSVVTFRVHPSSIIGSDFTRVTIVGIVDADSAIAQGFDAPTKHADVYSSLPVGTVNRFDGYQYLKIKLQNGSIEFIGIPWVDMGTYEIIVSIQASFLVTDITATDVINIKNILVANGYNKISVTTP